MQGLDGLDRLALLDGLGVLDGFDVFDGDCLEIFDQLLPNGRADPLAMEL